MAPPYGFEDRAGHQTQSAPVALGDSTDQRYRVDLDLDVLW